MPCFNITEISRFNRNIPTQAVLLENGYVQHDIKNPTVWTTINEHNDAYEIDIIFTKYPKKKRGLAKPIIMVLLSDRLKKPYFAIDPQLNSQAITWNIVLQNRLP